MARKKIKKVAVTELEAITGSIVDGTNIDDKEHNTYSANTIDNQIDTKIQSFHDTKKVYFGCDYLGQKNSSFNLNDLKAGECCYYSNSSLPVNYPASVSEGNFMVYCFYNISEYGSIQIAFPDGAKQNAYIYIRYRWGTGWTGWLKITLTA